jgi:DNA-binding NarL/FixJ family response regulator
VDQLRGRIAGDGFAVVRQDVLPYNKLKRPTILLADDYVAFHDIVRSLLEPEFEVIGAVENGLTLIDAAIRLTPDIIVSDIGMPILGGFEALRHLIAFQPDLRFIFLTINNDPDFIEEAKRAGASGYVDKSCAASELLPAIREAVREGEFFLSKFGT